MAGEDESATESSPAPVQADNKQEEDEPKSETPAIDAIAAAAENVLEEKPANAASETSDAKDEKPTDASADADAAATQTEDAPLGSEKAEASDKAAVEIKIQAPPPDHPAPSPPRTMEQRVEVLEQVLESNV